MPRLATSTTHLRLLPSFLRGERTIFTAAGNQVSRCF